MSKALLSVAAAVLIVGTLFADSTMAQGRRGRSDREPLTANQIVARSDAQTARIKADLRLTAEQEKNWPGLESALRDVGKSRADRSLAGRIDQAQQRNGDVIEFLNGEAAALGELSAEVKKLAEAAQPLYASLDDRQKSRLASELVRLSLGQGRE